MRPISPLLDAVEGSIPGLGRGHMPTVVVIVEGTDEAAAAAMLKIGSLGNVRSKTLRGFSVDEMKKIVSKMP